MFRRRLLLMMIGLLIFGGSFAVPASAVARKASTPPPPSEVHQWGSYLGGNSYQLKKPTPIGGLRNIAAIQASNSSTYALQCVGGSAACPTDGVVLAWGNGQYGQLGNNQKLNFPAKPVHVIFPAGVHIVSIGEARNEGFAIDQFGRGWVWGINGHDSLCLGNTTRQFKPVVVPGLTTATVKPTAVQGGQDHVLWLMSDGSVRTCGVNTNGQLGNNTNQSGILVKPPFPTGTVITAISAGNTTSAALDSTGNIWTWGDNRFGQCGVGMAANQIRVPTKVTLPSPATLVYAGGDLSPNGHMLAIAGGQAYAWGNDFHGQLGDGQTINESSPVLVKEPAGVTFTAVAAGGQGSLGLDTTGHVWAWGNSQGSTMTVVDHGVDQISSTANSYMDHLPVAS